MADEPNLQLLEVRTNHCGSLKVFVQGNLAEKNGKAVFLTMHDMGTNHNSFVNFVNQPSMREVKSHSVFLHVCAPGMEDQAPDWQGSYPSLSQIADDLLCVLDQAGVKHCIGLGDGAGANIVCRFAMAFPNRILGICLVHCTSTTAGVMEYIKDKMINWQMKGGIMTQGAWDYLIHHKFGPRQDETKDYVKRYVEDLQERIKPSNLSRFLQSFMDRTDISTSLTEKLKMNALLVVGSRASHLHTVYTMHQAMARDKAELLVVDGVGDVISEAPERLARALVLFCKGFGLLGGVSIPGMERQQTSRSMTMQEADKPRSSVTGALSSEK